jgi:NTP pyrophosphatase (non-canonical NTP hydrolase)
MITDEEWGELQMIEAKKASVVSPGELDLLEQAVDLIVDICHRMAAQWWIDPETGRDLRHDPLMVPVKLMLVVSEISEAMEGDRKDAMDDKIPHLPAIDVELGDALIRIADLAGARKMDLGRAIREKIVFNASRPDHKHENRVKSGGKKY